MGRSSSQSTQAPAPTSQPSAGFGPAVNNFGAPPAQQPIVQPQAPAQQPIVQPTGPNIFEQSSGALGQAQETMTGLSQFQPDPMQAATLGPAATMTSVGQVGDVTSGQLASTDMGQYMSPYTQQVIERGQADIERQRQLATQDLGASAQRAKAFGGSRHGVAEGTLAGEYGRMGMDFAAQQRQRAFDQAQQAAQYDIGQRFAADTLNQRAAEAAAQREQAARAGNMAAANQFAQQQAMFEQQANQATFGGQFQGAGIRQGAASGLSGLGGQMFGIGQQVQGAIGQQGQFQRGLQQQLLDRAMGQYGGATGAPMAGLGALTSVISGMPYGTTATSRTPFNPLGLLGAFI